MRRKDPPRVQVTPFRGLGYGRNETAEKRKRDEPHHFPANASFRLAQTDQPPRASCAMRSLQDGLCLLEPGSQTHLSFPCRCSGA